MPSRSYCNHQIRFWTWQPRNLTPSDISTITRLCHISWFGVHISLQRRYISNPLRLRLDWWQFRTESLGLVRFFFWIISRIWGICWIYSHLWRIECGFYLLTCCKSLHHLSRSPCTSTITIINFNYTKYYIIILYPEMAFILLAGINRLSWWIFMMIIQRIISSILFREFLLIFVIVLFVIWEIIMGR